MANAEHLKILEQGVDVWNARRAKSPRIKPIFRKADLHGRYLCEANLEGADLREANLNDADLTKAALAGANLAKAHLRNSSLEGSDLSRVEHSFDLLKRTPFGANLEGADLQGANLEETNLSGVNLEGADLRGAALTGAIVSEGNLRVANLEGTYLEHADLEGADLKGAHLKGAVLRSVYLEGANLRMADLRESDLRYANLVQADLTDANLRGARIYGISAWGLKLRDTEQRDLVITPEGEPGVTVDNIEVAQFIYLLMKNEKIRDVIDTVGKKAVLILGRFTPERKAVLDALREELRKRDYLPILFDFEKLVSRDLTATVSTLANLARFIIADLTDPSSIPYELGTVIPTTPVPIQPILQSGKAEFCDVCRLEAALRLGSSHSIL